jgi:hypothetical protein
MARSLQVRSFAVTPQIIFTQTERFLQAGASSGRSFAGGDKPRPYLKG